MSADIEMKVGDIRPRLDSTLQDANGAVDLTGGIARFLMLDEDDNTVIDQSSTGTQVTILSSTAGTVRYAWVVADTSTAGSYKAEWEVTFGDGSKATFPNNGWLSVLIREDLD